VPFTYKKDEQAHTLATTKLTIVDLGLKLTQDLHLKMVKSGGAWAARTPDHLMICTVQLLLLRNDCNLPRATKSRLGRSYC
jgi:hypothetical protein